MNLKNSVYIICLVGGCIMFAAYNYLLKNELFALNYQGLNDNFIESKKSSSDGAIKYKATSDHTSEYNILFVETNHKKDYFTTKQMCCIEAAAKHNPNALVQVFSIKASLNKTYLLEKYPNIKINAMDVATEVAGTPMENWWKEGKLQSKDDYTRFAHLSDGLRMLLIYKYGGIYLDTDILTLQSYSDIANLTAVANQIPHDIFIGNAYLSGPKNSSFFLECVENFSKHYNPNAWSANGQELINYVMRDRCKISSNSDLLTNVNKYPKSIEEEKMKLHNLTCGIHIYPFYMFFPIAWDQTWRLFSEEKSSINVTKYMYTRGIHFNNYASGRHEIERNKASIMEIFYKFNCPYVYQNEVV